MGIIKVSQLIFDSSMEPIMDFLDKIRKKDNLYFNLIEQLSNDGLRIQYYYIRNELILED